MYKNKLLVLIFDGIENSVFQSQVIAPLQKKLFHNPKLIVHIVSFERRNYTHKKIKSIIGKHPRLTCSIKQRLPIFSRTCLITPIISMLLLLKHSPNKYKTSILARGPIAGYVARLAQTLFSLVSKNTLLLPLIIQARGLASEEYRYASKKVNYKYRLLKKIEQSVYAPDSEKLIEFEAVSPALKTYLHKTFKTPLEQITIAQNDIPEIIETKQYEKYRYEIRKELNVSLDTTVYCYSGSAKPWQCPNETIAHFSRLYQRNQNMHLLILSLDTLYFEKLLSESCIPQESYRAINVSSDQLTHYLCAADYGYLLRDNDIINWVSRPTKLLEYQAAHLKVIHNNTIALLAAHNAHESIAANHQKITPKLVS